MKLTFTNVALLGLTLASSALANIAGSDPYAALPALDTCSGCLFAYVHFAAADVGQTVSSYQFYNGAGAGTTNYLTPILFEQIAPRTFQIIGLGASSTGFAAGFNTQNFVLTSGTATIQDTNTYFGYADASAAGVGNAGTIVMNYPTGPGFTSFYSLPAGALAVNNSLTFSAFTDPNTNQNDRTYSLQVETTAAATPEPSFYGMVALGLSGLVFASKRRRSNLSA